MPVVPSASLATALHAAAATHIPRLAPTGNHSHHLDKVTQWSRGRRRVRMYKPSRIYFRRQEACDTLALDFSTLEGSSVAEEEASKEVKRLEATSKEQGGWTQELRERQQRGSNSENETRQSQRKF